MNRLWVIIILMMIIGEVNADTIVYPGKPVSGITNGGSAVLTLLPGTTVSNATAGNQPITLDQYRQGQSANKDVWYTFNKVTTTPYTNANVTTNQIYLLNCTNDITETFVRTNPSVAIGEYYSANVCTSSTHTTFSGQSISIEKYVCENSAGNAYIIEEVYRFEPSSGIWREWGTAVASNLVDTGTTPLKSLFTVAVPTVSTNVPWMIATRTKRVGGTGSPDLIVGGGTNYPSHISFTESIDVFTADLLKKDGSRALSAGIIPFTYLGTNHTVGFGDLAGTQGIYFVTYSNTTTYTNWMLGR